MRRIFSYLIFIWVIQGLQAQEKEFVINGVAPILQENTAIYFIYKDSVGLKVDSTLVSQGRFCFRGQTTYPFLADIAMSKENNPQEQFSFYVEPGEIHVKVIDHLYNSQVTGSRTDSLNRVFHSQLNNIRQQVNQLQYTYQLANEESRSNKHFTDSLDGIYSGLVNTYNRIALDFIAAHPQEMLSLYMLRSELKIHPYNEQAQESYFKLSEEVKNSLPGHAVREMIEKTRSLSVGSQAPDFSYKDLNGKPIRLSDFQGKYVFLFFWSPECDHCLEEIPHLKEEYAKFKEKGLEMLAIGIAPKDGKEHLLNVIKEEGIEWLNISEFKSWEGNLTKLYNITAVPNNLLISPTGHILVKEIYGEKRMEIWNEIFE